MTTNGAYAIELKNVNIYYGDKIAVDTTPIAHQKITAFIGPFGCGKVRCCARSTA
jgi:ABC-type phosphate transport system ATPase subunit